MSSCAVYNQGIRTTRVRVSRDGVLEARTPPTGPQPLLDAEKHLFLLC